MTFLLCYSIITYIVPLVLPYPIMIFIKERYISNTKLPHKVNVQRIRVRVLDPFSPN